MVLFWKDGHQVQSLMFDIFFHIVFPADITVRVYWAIQCFFNSQWLIWMEHICRIIFKTELLWIKENNNKWCYHLVDNVCRLYQPTYIVVMHAGSNAGSGSNACWNMVYVVNSAELGTEWKKWSIEGMNIAMLVKKSEWDSGPEPHSSKHPWPTACPVCQGGSLRELQQGEMVKSMPGPQPQYHMLFLKWHPFCVWIKATSVSSTFLACPQL